ncbi:MAG: HAD family hydrolase [Candidatus Natronoplasma sp.]
MVDKLIIFDLDGTLYKTEEVSVPALKEVFSDFGIEVTEEIILNQFGEPTEKIIENLVPEEKSDLKDQISEAIVKSEREWIPERATLYEGVKDLLNKLQGRGYNMAICSNGRDDYIEQVLKTTSIDKYFSSVEGYTPGKNKSDLIRELISEFSPDETFMVGDRYHDIEAAEEAGVTSIGALYGYGDEEAKKADKIAEKPIDILTILRD